MPQKPPPIILKPARVENEAQYLSASGMDKEKRREARKAKARERAAKKP